MTITRLKHAVSVHRGLLSLLAIHLAILTFVLPPTGEYPICDDGVFAATARDIVYLGRPRISNLPSMALLTHAAWGAAFLAVLGDSWFALHVSTVAMVWIGTVALYVLCLELGRRPADAALFAGCYLFHPLVFADSYTFMTDLTGVSLMLVSLAALPAALRSGTALSFARLGMLAALCYLARQTAAIPLLMLGVWLTWECLRKKRPLRVLAAFGLCAALPVAGFQVWLHLVNGVPSALGTVPFDAEIVFEPKGLLSKALSLLLESSLMIVAASIALCLAAPLSTRSRGQTAWLVLLGGVFSAGVLVFSDELRPYRGYSLFDAGLGFPPTHDGLYEAFAAPALTTGLSAFQAALLVPAAVSLAAIVGVGIVQWRPAWMQVQNDRLLAVAAIMLLSFATYFALLLLLEFVFDRYVIPLSVLMTAGLAALSCEPLPVRSRLAGWGLLAVTAACAVAGTADMVTSRDLFWQTVHKLWDAGVPRDRIDAGIAYLETYLYEAAIRERPDPEPTFLSGLEPGAFNGYERGERTWRLAYRSGPGWEVVERIPYYTCLRKCELLVLRATTNGNGVHDAVGELVPTPRRPGTGRRPF